MGINGISSQANEPVTNYSYDSRIKAIAQQIENKSQNLEQLNKKFQLSDEEKIKKQQLEQQIEQLQQQLQQLQQQAQLAAKNSTKSNKNASAQNNNESLDILHKVTEPGIGENVDEYR